MFYPNYSYNRGNSYFPQSLMPEPQGNNLKGRLVTSLDEAKNAMIDFDGSVFYFPDLAKGKIYTKQINLDGSSTVKVYSETTEDSTSTMSFVTEERYNALSDKVNDLIEQIQSLKGEKTTNVGENVSKSYNF